MSVWFVIPSKRPLAEANACLDAWHDMGYLTAVLREYEDGKTVAHQQLLTNRYQGWARSTNVIIQSIMVAQDQAEWFVAGGDDYWPDPHRRADDIAKECTHYFNERFARPSEVLGVTGLPSAWPDTFGVMQPTGDRWGEGRCTTCNGTGRISNPNNHEYVPGGVALGGGDGCHRCGLAMAQGAHHNNSAACSDCYGSGRSAVIDRICGSPWMGREFCRRMYQGSGPLYNGYYHNFADEELQNVARKLGVFWQRRDIVQEHRHWAQKQPKSETHTGLAGDVRNMPEWAIKINDPKLSDWERSKALFAKRKASGFPGHEPLEV